MIQEILNPSPRCQMGDGEWINLKLFDTLYCYDNSRLNLSNPILFRKANEKLINKA